MKEGRRKTEEKIAEGEGEKFPIREDIPDLSWCKSIKYSDVLYA